MHKTQGRKRKTAAGEMPERILAVKSCTGRQHLEEIKFRLPITTASRYDLDSPTTVTLLIDPWSRAMVSFTYPPPLTPSTTYPPEEPQIESSSP